jgi:hypothetical protein
MCADAAYVISGTRCRSVDRLAGVPGDAIFLGLPILRRVYALLKGCAVPPLVDVRRGADSNSQVMVTDRGASVGEPLP